MSLDDLNDMQTDDFLVLANRKKIATLSPIVQTATFTPVPSNAPPSPRSVFEDSEHEYSAASYSIPQRKKRKRHRRSPPTTPVTTPPSIPPASPPAKEKEVEEEKEENPQPESPASSPPTPKQEEEKVAEVEEKVEEEKKNEVTEVMEVEEEEEEEEEVTEKAFVLEVDQNLVGLLRSRVGSKTEQVEEFPETPNLTLSGRPSTHALSSFPSFTEIPIPRNISPPTSYTFPKYAASAMAAPTYHRPPSPAPSHRSLYSLPIQPTYTRPIQLPYTRPEPSPYSRPSIPAPPSTPLPSLPTSVPSPTPSSHHSHYRVPTPPPSHHSRSSHHSVAPSLYSIDEEDEEEVVEETEEVGGQYRQLLEDQQAQHEAEMKAMRDDLLSMREMLTAIHQEKIIEQKNKQTIRWEERLEKRLDADIDERLREMLENGGRWTTDFEIKNADRLMKQLELVKMKRRMDIDEFVESCEDWIRTIVNITSLICMRLGLTEAQAWATSIEQSIATNKFKYLFRRMYKTHKPQLAKYTDPSTKVVLMIVAPLLYQIVMKVGAYVARQVAEGVAERKEPTPAAPSAPAMPSIPGLTTPTAPTPARPVPPSATSSTTGGGEFDVTAPLNRVSSGVGRQMDLSSAASTVTNMIETQARQQERQRAREQIRRQQQLNQ